MASTYSTNLALELIGTGDQSGTWGITTNTTLGTLIEQAIVSVGSVVYASDANKTITMPNGSSSATRCAYLVVTSGVSLTTTRELIVPTIYKNYLVYNGTTGGQTITVKTAAGTGVDVPTGKRMHLWVDGTNVIEDITYMTSVDTVTQTVGNNTTKLATTAFVQEAVDLIIASVPLSIGTTAGDTIYWTGASTPVRLGIGSAYQNLRTNAAGTAPEWAAPSVPQNAQNAGYTCVLSDAGKHILMGTAGTFTIPANASVAYPIGTVLTFVNGTTACTIPITSDTMTLAGTSSTGTRTLAANGLATALKITATTWIISGSGLT